MLELDISILWHGGTEGLNTCNAGSCFCDLQRMSTVLIGERLRCVVVVGGVGAGVGSCRYSTSWEFDDDEDVEDDVEDDAGDWSPPWPLCPWLREPSRSNARSG